ncbi:MAG: C45 family peptidase, partial [Muribaculaceae bacterium]|nr:C45 family peptidase [Muribaculaceae bacterium]
MIKQALVTYVSAAIIAAMTLSCHSASACTSAIISAKASADGRPILWKHRDTSASNNYLYRVENPGQIGYVGLFNGADSLDLSEAWMGMNDEGFAIMNTVAYNLPENDPSWIDREGAVMAKALATCRTVDDFEQLLRTLPKPMGVRTNFGVIDAQGNGAYFETDDWNYEVFRLADAPDGVLLRTNYAYSGQPDDGMGYIRHSNLEYILKDEIATGTVTPATLTEKVSRSFYHSMLGSDLLESGGEWAIDQDFIPRRSSTASIAIEGLLPGESPRQMMMWANLGYPPC